MEQLSEQDETTVRPMFGGQRIYRRDVIFGIRFGERLYSKVDDRSKGIYVSRGMPSLRPNERQTLMSYFEVPPEILADREALLSWAKEAMRAGMASQDPPR
jgi:DNA transformation protein